MNTSLNRAFAIIAGLAVVALPIALALYQSQRLSVQAATEEALVLSREVLRRADETTDQIGRATDRLLAAGAVDPCSDANIALMRQLDVTSSYIQTVGAVVDGQLACTSLGRHDPPLPLGPVAYVGPQGAGVRPAVPFDFSPGLPMTVVETSGYAAVIHRDLVIDVFTDNPHASIGLFAVASRTPVMGRGHFDPAWTTPVPETERAVYEGSHLVAVSRSRKYDFAAYAALPADYVDAGTRRIALGLAPFGALVGVLMMFLLLMLSRRQASLPTMIRTGLRQDEFFLHYQPIIELATRRCVGVEALLRWRRKDGTMMRPDLFIPAAEDSGLIRLLTARVLRLLRADAAAVLAVAPGIHFNINLSPEDLRSDRIVDELRALLEDAALAPANLHVEMTERGMVNTDRTRAVVSAIRALGIEVAIDDFGTGFCSLSYLTTFEVDVLKIDKSFVDTLGLAAASSQVALHIISMGKQLNLRMVAEGVETEDQAAILRESGVQFAQGWLYAKAMEPAALLDYLRG